MEYLDFELPIKDLEDQLEKCIVIGRESDVDVTNTCKQINKKLIDTKTIYKKFDSMATCTIVEASKQAYTLDHVRALVEILLELHGDRGFKDDKAMIGGLGKWSIFMIVGQQKDITRRRQYRNFGMANPEGYRKRHENCREVWYLFRL
jgi:acetyl-CoA carboxylase carboxyl transferase subunit alpha